MDTSLKQQQLCASVHTPVHNQFGQFMNSQNTLYEPVSNSNKTKINYYTSFWFENHYHIRKENHDI